MIISKNGAYVTQIHAKNWFISRLVDEWNKVSYNYVIDANKIDILKYSSRVEFS